MTSEVVTTERVGPAMVVRIDRKSSGNAISREVVAGLTESVREAAAADGLAAVVITGSGGKFFAAGGDLKQYRELLTRSEDASPRIHRSSGAGTRGGAGMVLRSVGQRGSPRGGNGIRREAVPEVQGPVGIVGPNRKLRFRLSHKDSKSNSARSARCDGPTC